LNIFFQAFLIACKHFFSFLPDGDKQCEEIANKVIKPIKEALEQGVTSEDVWSGMCCATLLTPSSNEKGCGLPAISVNSFWKHQQAFYENAECMAWRGEMAIKIMKRSSKTLSDKNHDAMWCNDNGGVDVLFEPPGSICIASSAADVILPRSPLCKYLNALPLWSCTTSDRLPTDIPMLRLLVASTLLCAFAIALPSDITRDIVSHDSEEIGPLESLPPLSADTVFCAACRGAVKFIASILDQGTLKIEEAFVNQCVKFLDFMPFPTVQCRFIAKLKLGPIKKSLEAGDTPEMVCKKMYIC
uniref:Saposin B-type domain-containing protein n=1 Tax=Haemonchus placei TaxID=6290 RepID=A0A0N4WVM6_HAEPC